MGNGKRNMIGNRRKKQMLSFENFCLRFLSMKHEKWREMKKEENESGVVELSNFSAEAKLF